MTDPVLEALWKKVLDDWDDEGAHGAFLRHCGDTNQLLEAAVRYRGMAGDHVRGEGAEKRLPGIAALAMARLETERTTPPSRANAATVTRLVLIAFFLAGTAVLSYALMR